MADEEQQIGQTEAPQAKFPPGVLCPSEVLKDREVNLTESQINALSALRQKIAERDLPAFRQQIIDVWQAREFSHGNQHLLPLRGGGWKVFGYGSNPNETQEIKSMFDIDIYSSYMEIVVAALTREVPEVRFEPNDPDDDVDITASESAEKLKADIERNIGMKAVLSEEARLLWTDGRVIKEVQYELNAQKFGYEPDAQPEGEVPEDFSSIQEGSATVASGFQRGTEPASLGDGRSAPTGEQPTETSESGQTPAAPKQARGRESVRLHGALESKIPMKASRMAECGYVRLSKEIPVSLARSKYPEKAEQIHSSVYSGNTDQIDRLARVQVMLGSRDTLMTTQSVAYECTETRLYLRPSELMDGIGQDSTRDELLELFPEGAYVIWCGETFCEAYNASMDDHLSMTFALPGDGANRPALGSKMIPIAKIVNNWCELANDYLTRGIPMMWMDETTFPKVASSRQSYMPGSINTFQSDGNPVEGIKVFREPELQFPDELIALIQYAANELSQLLSGTPDAMFSGDSAADDASGAALMIRRDMSLGRIGTPWRNIKQGQADMMRQAVVCLAENHTDPIRIQGSENIVIEMSDLKGNIRAFPDTDENFPESWTQKQNRIISMFQESAQNPMLLQLLDDPDNVEQLMNSIGLEDFSSPILEARDKQLGEIELLLKSGPLPNPALTEAQGMLAQLQTAAQTGDPQAMAALQAAQQKIAAIPPEISTVQITEWDDHATELATCVKVLNSPRGRALRNSPDQEEQQGWQNLSLHAKEHQAQVKAQQAAGGPAKPVSSSIAIKDLPPPEAAELAQKAGLQANPADFSAQDEAQAAAKHPGSIAPPVLQ